MTTFFLLSNIPTIDSVLSPFILTEDAKNKNGSYYIISKEDLF